MIPNLPFKEIPIDVTEEQAKKLDAKYNKRTKSYSIPATLHRLRELYKLTHKDEIIALGKERKSYLDGIRLMKEQSDTKGNKLLRPYQRVDAAQVARLSHCALFLEMRLGKTPISIEAMKLSKAKKIIVVCPASLLYNWEDEIRKWSDTPSLVATGTKPKRKKLYDSFTEGYLIISYETLRSDEEELYKYSFDAMICDEAHRLKNPQSKQSKAVYKVGSKAKKRVALTGTPTQNTIQDIFGILKFLYPKTFTSYWNFMEQYFHMKDSFFGGQEVAGLKRSAELQEILDSISIMRKQKDVMKWLPEKEFRVIPVKMEAAQTKHYNEMKKFFETDNIDAPSILAQMTRLRQICTCPNVLGLKCDNAKESALLDLLNGIDKPLIIFSTFTSYLKEVTSKLTAKGYKVALLIGETPTKERQEIVRRFQNGKLDIILANIRSAGAGLTLDKAKTCIFLDRDYNPSANAQAIERMTPTQQDRNHGMTVIDLVIKDSMDSKIQKLLSEKIAITEVVNNYRKYLL